MDTVRREREYNTSRTVHAVSAAGSQGRNFVQGSLREKKKDWGGYTFSVKKCGLSFF